MIHYSDPPILLRNVLDDVDAARGAARARAPRTHHSEAGTGPTSTPTPPPARSGSRTTGCTPIYACPAPSCSCTNPRVLRAARDFYGADVIVPHSVYVNVMVALDRAGPAHTDNPRFQGRDRSNTPMWLCARCSGRICSTGSRSCRPRRSGG
jgi:hypothetical protein